MKQFIPMLEVANHHTSRFRGRTARRLGRCALAGALMAGALEKSADAAEAGTLPPTVVVLVESKLIPPLEASLNQHQLDLEHEGYRVRRIAVEASATAHHVRALLANEWAAGKSGLVGAVLVGDIPALLYNIPGQEGRPYWHDHLCDAYYADLDGEWTDANANGVYDGRAGRIGADIWVSRIKPNNPALLRDRAELIRDYFARNHAYRTGTLTRPPRRAFAVWTTADVLRSTRWGARPSVLYGDSVTAYGGCYIEGAAEMLRAFLRDPHGYELGIVNCVSGAKIHHLDPHAPGERVEDVQQGKSGPERQQVHQDWLDVNHGEGDITSEWIAKAKPKTLFFHLLTSEPGRHDRENYLCGAYLFGGSALVVIAGTQHSGAVGSPNIYPDLAAGKSFGEAWRDGLNYGISHAGEPFVTCYCWEKDIGAGAWSAEGSIHTKAVLHGDGTLRVGVATDGTHGTRPDAEAAAEPITVESPPDGGWPRQPGKIVRNGPGDFTVDPDGHKAYVMVEVVNRSQQARLVSLRGFTTNFGRIRNTQTYSDRHYLYVRPAGGRWERVYRHGNETTYPYSPLIINVPPGRTRVGTVVDFTHQEYSDYVESLHDSRLKKEVVLTSGNGAYKVHRLRITNPGGRDKLRIALARTNHAYERSGYYMAQGAIAWLLSGDPAANLDCIEWTIYPCLDPQAVHDGQNYIEHHSLILDDGRPQHQALWHPVTGELPSQHYHVLTDVHMWEMRDWESYKYNDPFAPRGKAGNGRSEIERVMLGFWPYWYEFGIDAYDHENKWQAANALPQNFGGALTTHLEIPYYGKDDIDPRDRLREQGRLWARSHSQAYLRMQKDRRYWDETSPGGPVNVDGAVILPVPQITMLEDLQPLSGQATPRANAAGQPMQLYHEIFEHGVGMRSGDSVTYAVPPNANTFRAMAGVQDSEETPDDHHTVQFVAQSNNGVLWRSRPLKRSEREMAVVDVSKTLQLVLRVEGPPGLLANWGGAKFTANDPEAPANLTAQENGIRANKK